MKNKIIYIITIMTGCYSMVNAQKAERQVIGTIGTSYQGSTIRLDHTIGEAVITTIQSGSFVMTQGFHQPINESSTGINNKHNIDVTYKLYPNPTSHILNVELSAKTDADINIAIIDMQGRTVYQIPESIKIYGSTLIQLPVSSFSDGIYMVNINDNYGTVIHSIKFIKKM